MTIRQTNILFSACIVGAMVLFLLLAANYFYLNRIDLMESQRASDHAEVVLNLLRKSSVDMGKWAHDWAAWDEAYQFMVDGNREFIAKNLNPETFKYVGVENVLFIAMDGALRYARSYDLERLTDSPISAPVLEKLRQFATMTHSAGEKDSTHGIIRVDGTYYLVGAHPVLPTRRSGPAHGILVFADQLESNQIKEMSNLLHQHFALMPLTDPRIPEKIRAQLQQLPTERRSLSFTIDQARLGAVATLKDAVTGEKVVVLLEVSRSYLAESRNLFLSFLVGTILLGSAGIIGQFVLFGRTVVRPLERLCRELDTVREGQTVPRISRHGIQELDYVAEAVSEALGRAYAEEERYRALVESQLDLVSRWLPDGTITYANEQCCRLSGLSREEHLASTYDRFLPPQSVADKKAFMTRMVAESRPGKVWQSKQWYQKGEKRVWIEWITYPIFDRHGDLQEFQSVGRDVTAREEAELALRGSEERHRLFMQEFSGIALIVTRDHDAVFLQGAFKEISGDDPDPAKGHKQWFDRVHPDDRQRFLEHVERSRNNPREPVRMEYRIIRADGSIRWIYDIQQGLMEDDGTCNLFHVVIYDINDRKLAEEKMHQALRLSEAANRAKSTFLAAMSHELRTPLNSILGYAETLQEGLLGPVTEGQEMALVTIEASGRHLLALINDILDLAKIEAGKLDIYQETIHVGDIVRTSLSFVKEQAYRKNITLSWPNVPDSLKIMTDQRRLKQILVNLLTNGVKFTPEGGKVGMEVIQDRESGTIRFELWDTGIGISNADRENLFKPFEQLNTAESRQQEGTGLGLSLALRLTRLLQGDLTLESEPGRGSRFMVTLPWGEEFSRTEVDGEVAVAAPETVISPEASAFILVADDNPATREMLKVYFRTRGCRIQIAVNGDAVVALAREQRPDIILMDIQMPGSGGLEAIRRIREFQEPENKVPIIALTALAMPGDRERCLEAGADDYMTKPVNLKELYVRIQELVDNPAGQERTAG